MISFKKVSLHCSLALFSLVVSAGMLSTTWAQSGAGKTDTSGVRAATQIEWLGQAGFRITTPGGKLIVVDPWIKGGPKTPQKYKNDFAALGKIDLLLVSHGHGDHLGDAPDLAKLNKTKLYGPADMVTPLITIGALPADLGHRFNKSGTVKPLEGIKVTAVRADHSSLIVWPDAQGKPVSHAGGEQIGFIIELENGFKIWHMGDTGLFTDMAFIAQYYKPDLVMIPIGGNFTMGPEEAAFAIKTWIKPKMVLPMHYNSNPLTPGTLAEFQAAMKGSDIKIVPMTEGQTLNF